MYSVGMIAPKDKYEGCVSMTEIVKISFMKHTKCIKEIHVIMYIKNRGK